MYLRRWLLLMGLALIGLVSGATLDDPYAAQRRRMVRAIEADVNATSARLGERALEAQVLDVMGSVPRHELSLLVSGTWPMRIGHCPSAMDRRSHNRILWP
jgi:hypothetical protein